MAVFETTRPLSNSVRTTKTSMLARVTSAVLAWNDRRVTRNALQKLTARELKDIGLTHADLADL